ncbi:putative yVTN beta-propeller repeat-containing protein [Mycobacterium xenopi 4042]|uniref:Putative yVTN beta-propeller repeat-containing protein n=1 Tax=Mycobacterium xenopi 4042 TaxID=1299334 RepID=X8BG28_MYCXE|nr:putative yVTN beta-propeller repeat-containing protein [Mycobacterium xenopi 4042]
MLAAVVVLAASCSHPAGPVDGTATSSTSSTKVAGSSKPAPPRAGPSRPSAATCTPARPGIFAAGVSADRPLVYVPHNRSGDVWEIDPVTYEVVAKYPVGREIQHVVPAHDMRTLYATDDVGNQMLALDPRTGQPGVNIPILDPYNLYFTPDGRFAISVAERLRSLIWYSPVTWQLLDKTPSPNVRASTTPTSPSTVTPRSSAVNSPGAWRWSTSARTGCCAPLTCRHAIPTWAHRTSGSPRRFGLLHRRLRRRRGVGT